MARAARNDAHSLNLPDFCAARAVLAVVLIVTLTAVVLAVARQSTGLNFWLDLAQKLDTHKVNQVHLALHKRERRVESIEVGVDLSQIV